MALWLPEPEREGVRDALCVPDSVGVRDCVVDGVGEDERVEVPVGVAVGLRVTDTEADDVWLRVGVFEGVGACEGVAVVLGVVTWLRVDVELGLCVTLGVRVADMVPDPLFVADPEPVGAVDGVPEPVELRVGVTDGVCVRLGERDPVALGVDEAVPLPVGLLLGDGEAVPDCVGDPDGDANEYTIVRTELSPCPVCKRQGGRGAAGGSRNRGSVAACRHPHDESDAAARVDRDAVWKGYRRIEEPECAGTARREVVALQR